MRLAGGTRAARPTSSSGSLMLGAPPRTRARRCMVREFAVSGVACPWRADRSRTVNDEAPGPPVYAGDPGASKVGETGFEPGRHCSDNYATTHAFSSFSLSRRPFPGSVLCPRVPRLVPALPQHLGDIEETVRWSLVARRRRSRPSGRRVRIDGQPAYQRWRSQKLLSRRSGCSPLYFDAYHSKNWEDRSLESSHFRRS